jgi:hypothetical protein
LSEGAGTTVEDLVATMRERKARIPSDIGAFVALEVCESLLDAPAIVQSTDVRIADDGAIRVHASSRGASAEEAARSVLSILGNLLVAAGASVPKGLVSLIDAGPSAGTKALGSLRDDLEASLVPLNRAAARRVLSRLVREVRRSPSARPPEPAPRDASLDAQLDALLEGNAPAQVAETTGDASDATISESERRPLDEETIDQRAPEPLPLSKKRASERPAAKGRQETRRANLLPWILAVIAIVCAAAAGIAWFRPDLIDRAIPQENPPNGTLSVDVAPPGAQVLLFVGRGPALARSLSVGPHEFVAIVDGRAPTRAVLAPDAEWDRAPDGSTSYELAIQTSNEPASELELGPSGLASSPRSSAGVGDVRIVTDPPGAKVYVLAGISPDVTIDHLRTDQAAELLVYREGYAIERVVVGPSDWEGTGDQKHARVSVTLHQR